MIAIEAAGIGKRFGSLVALEDVSFRVVAGTVHALLGENGAGKSTLVKCLLGYHRADRGHFVVDGRSVVPAHPGEADRLGIGMVYQHSTLVRSMTVAENLVLARADVPALVRWRRERAALERFMQTVPFRLPLDADAGTLAAGQLQKAEIVKQLYLRRRFLVLDEPTSALTPQEADEVLGLMRGLAQAGRVTVLVITHKLGEVARVADAVTVLRRGRVVGGGQAASWPSEALARLMVGKADRPAPARRQGAPGAVRLALRGLRAADDRGGLGVDIAQLQVHGGEVVGIAGLSGNGQRELVEVLGGQRMPSAGVVEVEGRAYRATRAEAQAHGVRVLPEEPLRNGCAAPMSVADNLNLRAFDRDGGGRRRAWLDRAGLAARARRLMAEYSIRAPSPTAPIAVLSGGTVQRCVLARELDGDVRLLVAANPCAGLDLRAAAEIRARLVAARNGGAGVLLVSEDLDELLELADRILVMREGRLVYEVAAPGAGREAIGRAMTGAG